LSIDQYWFMGRKAGADGQSPDGGAGGGAERCC
jgi:hypothetical protein